MQQGVGAVAGRAGCFAYINAVEWLGQGVGAVAGRAGCFAYINAVEGLGRARGGGWSGGEGTCM